MSEASALYKLIILYILHKVTFPLSNSQLGEYILEKGYTNYFTMQRAISELEEARYITSQRIGNRTEYSITEDGATALSFFKNQIPLAIQEEIDQYLTDKAFDLRNETSVASEVYRQSDRDWRMHGFIKEGAVSLLDVTISLPTEEQAEQVADHWKKKYAEVYSNLMEELL